MGIGTEISSLLQWIAGAALWTFGNLVYFDMKRKGLRGFARLIAFWAGTPTTWVTFFLVPDGSTPHIEPPPDDEEALFREIRRDRGLRAASDAGAAAPPAAEEKAQGGA